MITNDDELTTLMLFDEAIFFFLSTGGKRKVLVNQGASRAFFGLSWFFFVGRSADGGFETNDCEYPWGDDAWGVRGQVDSVFGSVV